MGGIVLVTGVGGSAGRNTVAYLKERSIPFICADMNEEAGRDYAGKFHRIPPAKDVHFIDALLGLAKSQGATLLIPTVDEELIPVARNRALFENAGIRLVMPPLETIEICRDKYRTASFLGGKGIRVPKTVRPNDARSLGFPMLAKPIEGRGAAGITVFHDSAELDAKISEYDGSHIFQEFIRGDEYDVNMFIHGGEVLVNQVLRKTKLEFGEYGNAVETVPVRNKTIEAYSAMVAKALNAEGAIDIDIRMVDESTPCTLEINPRIGANVLKAKDILRNMLEIAGVG